MQTLTSVQRREWSGQIASLPLSFFSFLFSLPRPQVALCVRAGSMRAQNAFSRARKCLLGSERCAPKFWGRE